MPAGSETWKQRYSKVPLKGADQRMAAQILVHILANE